MDRWHGQSGCRGEVLPWPERRRRWSWEEKARIVAESLAPDAVASAIALRYALHRNQLYAWRKELRAAADEAARRLDATRLRAGSGYGRSGRRAGAIEIEVAGALSAADGLAAVVQTALWQDPFSGTIYVFRCKRADRVKLLVWDSSGLVLLWKRLESGVFRWPPVPDGVMRLSAPQLAALLDGLDWTRMHAPPLGRPKTAQ